MPVRFTKFVVLYAKYVILQNIIPRDKIHIKNKC